MRKAASRKASVADARTGGARAASAQADVRLRILDAALRLVASGGANELTQPRVGRAAGLRQGHLTYYFPTRADLLQAVAQHSIDALVSSLTPRPEGGVANAAGTKAARAKHLLPGLIAEGTGDPRRARLMLALVAAADRDAATRRRLRRFIVAIRKTFAAVLEAGGVRANARNIAFLHSVVVGAAVLQLARRDAASSLEARNVVRRAFDCLAVEK